VSSIRCREVSPVLKKSGVGGHNASTQTVRIDRREAMSFFGKSQTEEEGERGFLAGSIVTPPKACDWNAQPLVKMIESSTDPECGL
jgi:hypothetical protein